MKTSPNGCWSTPGVEEIEVNDLDEALRVIKKASQLRATNATKINQLSSRSHCIVSIRIISSNSEGKLNLIDLAGSENVGRSGAIGSSLREAQNINKSLSALGDVVHALIEKRRSGGNLHVPFRNSKLTMLLRDSLQGNSKTIMILQVSPAQADVCETMNSLSFGQRVRTVEIDKAMRNRVSPNTISPRE
jgi:kinesin family protein C2/C3